MRNVTREIPPSSSKGAGRNLRFVGCHRKRRASECKFRVNFYKRAFRDKLTFFCKEDSYKLKLYDQGAAASLANSVKILLLREAAKRELHESKTAEFESVTQRGPK